MVFLTDVRPGAAETGGIVSVGTVVQAKRREVVMAAVSVKSKRVFITVTSSLERDGSKNLRENKY
jgi:hypothetical protein